MIWFRLEIIECLDDYFEEYDNSIEYKWKGFLII